MSIEYFVSKAVAEITLNRPQALNALDPEAILAFRGALEKARDDATVRVILITGAGEKSFCTGSDLKSVQVAETSYAQSYCASDPVAFSNGARGRMLNLSKLAIWKPLIAAVNGYCLGGGMEIALQCDLRVASENASFGLTEPKIGSIAGICGPALLMRAVSPANAMKMLMTASRIDASEALRIGLISDVWKPDELMTKARDLAQGIADHAPLSISFTKRIAYDTQTLSVGAAIDHTELIFGVIKDTQDRLEGRQAFAEKRKPQFQGR